MGDSPCSGVSYGGEMESRLAHASVSCVGASHAEIYTSRRKELIYPTPHHQSYIGEDGNSFPIL